MLVVVVAVVVLLLLAVLVAMDVLVMCWSCCWCKAAWKRCLSKGAGASSFGVASGQQARGGGAGGGERRWIVMQSDFCLNIFLACCHRSIVIQYQGYRGQRSFARGFGHAPAKNAGSRKWHSAGNSRFRFVDSVLSSRSS